MGIQRPRDHARRERGEVLPQAPREREARQARSFPPRRRTLRRRNRDRQRASVQKATRHRSGATDRTTELVADTGGWIFGPITTRSGCATLAHFEGLGFARRLQVKRIDRITEIRLNLARFVFKPALKLGL